MDKSFFTFAVTAILINLWFCYAVGRCAVRPSSTSSSSSSSWSSSSSSSSASASSSSSSSSTAMLGDSFLLNAVNGSVMVNLNDSSEDAMRRGYSNTYGLERNTSDRNFYDEVDRLHNDSRRENLRERRKQQRLIIIQNRIGDLIGASVQSNATSTPRISDNERRRMAHIFEILQTYQQSTEPEDVSAERVQSFYPSCTLPWNTDKTLWEDPRLFHVYYDIPSPRLSQSTSLTVSSAKLRLFKSTVDMSASDAVACEDIDADDDGDHFMDRAREIEDHAERLRISIFQYVRPLRRNRRPKKKKLVDSRMVAADYGGWLDFDVGSSIRDWLENSSKNLGLEIVLEDALANTQNPSEYLHNMNCSEGVDNPFPHFADGSSIVEPSSLASGGGGSGGGTYPTLDLRTVEVIETVTSPNASIKKNDLNRRRRRRKRQATDGEVGLPDGVYCDVGNDANPSGFLCCEDNMNVTFIDLGFDSIVAPKWFLTKVCTGWYHPSDNRKSSDGLKTFKNTCSPEVMDPLDIIHYDEDGKLVISTIPDIVIKSCSCDGNNDSVNDGLGTYVWIPQIPRVALH